MYHRVHMTKIRLGTMRLGKVFKNLSGNLLAMQAESPSWRQRVSRRREVGWGGLGVCGGCGVGGNLPALGAQSKVS